MSGERRFPVSVLLKTAGLDQLWRQEVAPWAPCSQDRGDFSCESPLLGRQKNSSTADDGNLVKPGDVAAEALVHQQQALLIERQGQCGDLASVEGRQISQVVVSVAVFPNIQKPVRFRFGQSRRAGFRCVPCAFEEGCRRNQNASKNLIE